MRGAGDGDKIEACEGLCDIAYERLLGGRMWLAFALGSMVFSGVTSILAKCGLRTMDSTVATAIRTTVVVAYSWLAVAAVGSAGEMGDIRGETWLFLLLSGCATGASWLCHFKALQTGPVNQVEPIDKSSVVLTIVLAFLLLGEAVSALKGAAVVLIGAGTLLMVEKKKETHGAHRRSWIFYAVGSAVFASLTAIFGKIGIQGVDSTLGTAIRTVAVLVMAWGMVAVTGKRRLVRGASRREVLFLILSAVATGTSWLCYYRALQEGPASAVVPIDKMSIWVTILFSYFVFGERLTKRSGTGLCLITAGTLMMLW